VLAKVGGEGEDVMAARSLWKSVIAWVIAGRKWEVWMEEKGGTPPWGPVQGARRGLGEVEDMLRRDADADAADSMRRSRGRSIIRGRGVAKFA